MGFLQGIISWKDIHFSMGGLLFSWGGSILTGGYSMRGHRFSCRVFKNSHRLGWHPPCLKKKDKWNIKTEKKLLCLYFNNTSFTLLDFCWNKVYFKYTSKFADKYLSLESLLQVYLSFKINTSKWKICFLYTFEFIHI